MSPPEAGSTAGERHIVPPEPGDELLDRFMPAYDVVERHGARVPAAADVALAAAQALDLQASPLIRALFRARELLLRSKPAVRVRPPGLVAELLSLGWGVLAERPGREIVLGAVTKPWEANVTFRALPPGEFAAFDTPGLVKIAVTLRADPLGPGASMFRTETRVACTDPVSRARFRRYWLLVSTGVRLIRRSMVRSLKRKLATAGR